MWYTCPSWDAWVIQRVEPREEGWMSQVIIIIGLLIHVQAILLHEIKEIVFKVSWVWWAPFTPVPCAAHTICPSVVKLSSLIDRIDQSLSVKAQTTYRWLLIDLSLTSINSVLWALWTCTEVLNLTCASIWRHHTKTNYGGYTMSLPVLPYCHPCTFCSYLQLCILLSLQNKLVHWAKIIMHAWSKHPQNLFIGRWRKNWSSGKNIPLLKPGSVEHCVVMSMQNSNPFKAS